MTYEVIGKACKIAHPVMANIPFKNSFICIMIWMTTKI